MGAFASEIMHWGRKGTGRVKDAMVGSQATAQKHQN